MKGTTKASFAALLLPLAFCAPVWAAEPEAVGEANEEPGKTEGADVKVEGNNGEAKSVKELDPGEIERAKEAEKADSPIEVANKTYYFVGMRYRGMLLPKFMMNLFGDGGTSVYSNALGPEFTIRRNNFEYVLSAWWADYHMDPTPFKASTDPVDAWEIVTSKMNALYLTSDFNWTSQINPVFGLNFGLGAGFGFVWGDLKRVQAKPDGNGGYTACAGVGDHAWCGNDNKHYGNYTEPNWANGGSKPIVFPWLALQTGVRFKPHKNFMMRVDAGWAITGPFFGISGNYGL
jgi:hypothetical protein